METLKKAALVRDAQTFIATSAVSITDPVQIDTTFILSDVISSLAAQVTKSKKNL